MVHVLRSACVQRRCPVKNKLCALLLAFGLVDRSGNFLVLPTDPMSTCKLNFDTNQAASKKKVPNTNPKVRPKASLVKSTYLPPKFPIKKPV